MRALRSLLWLVAGMLLGLAVLEGVLRFMPVPGGLSRSQDTAAWPLRAYHPHHPYTYSSTWAMANARRGVTNNYGHVAPFDFRKNTHPVLVIGDSYVESQMNGYEKTLQNRLAEHLGSQDAVYGLGVSGLSLSDYLALAAMAGNEFKPRAAVFVITDGDVSESLLRSPGSYYFAPVGNGLRLAHPQDTVSSRYVMSVKAVVAQSALYRYVFGTLGFSFASITRVGASKKGAQDKPSAFTPDMQRQVIDLFLANVGAALHVPNRCVALLVDADRYAMYDRALAAKPKEAPGVRQYLLREADRLGFRVRDLGPVFEAYYAGHGERLDYWPLDRHWNATGHGIAAKEAYDLLERSDDKPCTAGASADEAADALAWRTQSISAGTAEREAVK